MKEITIPAAPIHLGKVAGNILITPPYPLRESIFNMVDKAGWDYKFRIRIATQWTPRTTGWKSQNHHFRGHCRSILEQSGNTMTAVARAIKEFAVENWGYPEVEEFGKMQPKSEADLSTTEEALLIEAAHHFAAEWNYDLVEE